MTEAALERLKCLPRHAGETWQGGLVHLPIRITGEGPEPFLPFLPVWVALEADKVHFGEMRKPDEQNLGAAVEALFDFALEDKYGGYRPGRVEVRDPALAEHLGGLLSGAGIEVGLIERLEVVDRVVAEMLASKYGPGDDIPGPLEGPGVTVDRMRSYAEAAAAFYEAALWRFLTDADLVHIEKPKPPRDMKYAVVLGAAGNTYGLGFFPTVREYANFCSPVLPQHRAMTRGTRLWQVTFNPASEIPVKDAAVWVEHRLPVAGESAYPLILKVGASGKIGRAGTTELLFVELLLRAFAKTSEAEIDSGRWQKTVTIEGRTRRMSLAIPDLLTPPTFQEWMERGFPPDRRAAERMHADMGRYFQQHPPADMEEMNAVLKNLFTGKRIDELVTEPETPLEEAQELCYQAFETYGRRRVQLARQALEVCPDCADAYVLLAEQFTAPAAELDYFTKGVAAGERALGTDVFEKEAGRFWGVTATRPYMRARFGLAQTLERNGRPAEAVEHYQELLRLNPQDNQGVRYVLMPQLLELGRDAEAARLLKSYDEKTANWTYARALLAFRLSGRSTAARRELRTAFRANPYVPEYLLGDEPPPMPEHYALGSPEEAMYCAVELRSAFVATEGALEWLAAEYRQRQRELETRRREQRRKERQKRKKRKGR